MGDYSYILNYSYQSFTHIIFNEYRKYLQNDRKRSGFHFIELHGDYYQLQKHFEKIMEALTREILINKVFQIILENKGIGIYRQDSLTNIYGQHEYLTNKEYEDYAKSEFIADFENKRILFRYTYDDLENLENLIDQFVDEVVIIDWQNFAHVGESMQSSCNLNKEGTVKAICLLEFFHYYLQMEDSDYNGYIMFLLSAINSAENLIGVKTVPALDSHQLGQLRIDIQSMIFKYIEQQKSYYKMNTQLESEFPDYNCKIFCYHTLKEENCELSERANALLFESGLLDQFESNKFYRYLMGLNNLSFSLMTSEYLYNLNIVSAFHDNTAIATGYLKSVEQLVYHIVKMSIDRGLKIQNKNYTCPNKNDPKKPYKPKLIEWNKENEDYADTSLGSLQKFLKYYSKHIFHIDKKYVDTIIDCLGNYRDECRNKSFHLDNTYSKSMLAFIRDNTLFLHIVLLGSCINDQTIDRAVHEFNPLNENQLKIEKMYDLILRGIDHFEFYTNTQKIGQYQLDLSQSQLPIYDQRGIITSVLFAFINTQTKQHFLISEKYMPERIDWVDEEEKTHILT